MRYFFLLCFLVGGRLLFAQAEATVVEPDELPYFPGCEMYEAGSAAKRQCSNQALVNFVASHVIYPEDARLEQLEGTVYARFTVDATGAVRDAALIRDIGGGTGEEALRVIGLLPNFEPAQLDGRPVAAELRLPVQFRSETATTDESSQYTLSWGALRQDSLYAHELIELLEYPVYVRNALGEVKPLAELAFAYAKNGKTKGAESRGSITKELRKIVYRIKRGGTFKVYAAVQDQGAFFYLERQVVVR